MDEKTSEKSGSAENKLGQHLARLRTLKGLTLRQVEEATDKKVSNAYLSQLEKGHITKPSAQALYSLSLVYGEPYDTLMEKAGYLAPAGTKEGERHGRTATLPIDDLDEDEEKELIEFLSYLRFKRKKK